MIEMLGLARYPFLDCRLYGWLAELLGRLRQAQEPLNKQQIGCDSPESRRRISFVGTLLQKTLTLLKERTSGVTLPRFAAVKKLIEQVDLHNGIELPPHYTGSTYVV
jgi:hypothetical protein